MARQTLYRIYLYTVCVGLLVFVAFMWQQALAERFYLYVFHSPFTPPVFNTLQVRDDTANAIVALLVALAVGGFHYRLIRRDIQTNTEAAGGGVRATTLNASEFVAALLALFAGLITLQSARLSLTDTQAYDVARSLALTIVAGFVLALLQVERARTRPAAGEPLGAQRVHLYLVLTVALVADFYAWVLASGKTIAFLSSQGAADQLIGEWLGVVWVTGILLLYVRFARGDVTSLRRLVAQCFGFAFSVVWAAVGVWGAASVALGAALGVPADRLEPLAPSAPSTFIPYLLFGALAGTAYGWWLQREAPISRLGVERTRLVLLAILAFTLGIPFYVGLTLLAQTALLQPPLVDAAHWNEALWLAMWAVGGGLVVAGLAHAPLALLLRRRSAQWTEFAAREGFLLGGIAAGVLTAGVGVTFVLIRLTSGALDTVSGIGERLGTAFEKFWKALVVPGGGGCQATTSACSRGGGTSLLDPQAIALLVVVVVGVSITVAYYWRARRERLLPTYSLTVESKVSEGSGQRHHGRTRRLAVADAAHIERVVSELLSGSLSSEQAVEQLCDLTASTPALPR
jgi:hypothetical protein